MKQFKKTVAKSIAAKTGLSTCKARKAVQAALDCIQRALADGKKVDLGKKLGKLVVVERKPKRRINKNLRHVGPNIEDVHKKHPKTVRLVGRGRDLSEDPQPTVIKRIVRRPVAIAFPSWRRRIR
jgi:nucleoid DNA-binding protein